MKQRKAYPTDLSDRQWEQLVDLIPRKRTALALMREYIDASLYVLKSGCSWRMLPHDFPPWTSVYTFFQKLSRDGTWERINRALHSQVRQTSQRAAEPSVLIADSQSVKTTEKGGRGATTAANK